MLLYSMSLLCFIFTSGNWTLRLPSVSCTDNFGHDFLSYRNRCQWQYTTALCYSLRVPFRTLVQSYNVGACVNFCRRNSQWYVDGWLRFITKYVKRFINTFTAIVDLSRFNNSCLKSPASTLVDLTFQSLTLRSFSLNQLRNLSL